MFAFIGSLIAGAAGLFGSAATAAAGMFGGLISAAGGAAAGLGTTALSTIGTAGGAVLTTAGKTVGLAGQAAAGGIGILGSLPAAATTTVDYLGELAPIVTGAVQTYRSITGEEPAGPAEYRAPGAAPAPPGPTILALPILGSQAQEKQAFYTTPGPAAEPNYLLYAGIALAVILLLRKK